MNRIAKIVFSRSLEHASWDNTEVMRGDLARKVRDLKDGGEGLPCSGRRPPRRSVQLGGFWSHSDFGEKILLYGGPVTLQKCAAAQRSLTASA